MANEDARRFLPNAYIQAVAYRGTTAEPGINYQLDAKNIAGSLDAQIREACRFVNRNMRVFASKHIVRRDRPQFAMTAIFEAVVNAVAHRDCSIYGSKIRLKLFADRLELYSPGSIPNTMTVESLPYRQSARNEVIASLLAKCPVGDDAEWQEANRRTLMEKRGDGVPVILEASERASGRTPVYRLIDDAELLLTIFAANEFEDIRSQDKLTNQIDAFFEARNETDGSQGS